MLDDTSFCFCEATVTARGTLYLVVGPSGAGKDSLISAAAQHRADLWVAPRMITREPVDNEHIEISAEEFNDLKRQGHFLLNWDAHGLRYGISRDLLDKLEAGQSIIVNGSRSIVQEAREDLAPVKIIHVVAPVDQLTRRLRERGREDEYEIENRIGRSARLAPRGPDVITVDNSGTLEEGVTAFLAALE